MTWISLYNISSLKIWQNQTEYILQDHSIYNEVQEQIAHSKKTLTQFSINHFLSTNSVPGTLLGTVLIALRVYLGVG